MNRYETKTGQSIDAVKHGVINPVLVKCVLGIPELSNEFSLIDIGSGDATSVRDLIELLMSAGHRIKDLCFVDADVKIFPDLVGTSTSESISLWRKI